MEKEEEKQSTPSKPRYEDYLEKQRRYDKG
jgi:hypothetical protein